MARIHATNDEEQEAPPAAPVSLAGLIKFQPRQSGRNKGQRAWRPMQLSDLGEEETAGTPETDQNEDASNDAVGSLPSNTDYYSQPALKKASLLNLPRLQTNFANSPPLKTEDSNLNSQDEKVGTDHSAADETSLLFGKLPDPVHLQMSVGEFNGQVIFIGHPNRDISAHQWDDASFQWVNIGQYSHLRQKIEGKLSQERLKGQTIVRSIAPNTLAYFQAVARQREKEATEPPSVTLPMDRFNQPSQFPLNSTFQRAPFGEPAPGPFVPRYHEPSPSTDARPLFRTLADRSKMFELAQTPSPVTRRPTKETLDDPFVVTPMKTAESPQYQVENARPRPLDPSFLVDHPVRFKFKQGALNAYTLAENTAPQPQQPFIENKAYMTPELAPQKYPATTPGSDGSGLRVIDAKTTDLATLAELTSKRAQGQLSPEDQRSRHIIKQRLVELGESAKKKPSFTFPAALAPATNTRPPPVFGTAAYAKAAPTTIAVPSATLNTAGPSSTLNAVGPSSIFDTAGPSSNFNATGVTSTPNASGPASIPNVAGVSSTHNPAGVSSTLNAAAAPYITSSQTLLNRPDHAATMRVQTNNINLRFSDPDRHPQNQKRAPEIAPGLQGRKPTKQHFEGPFFTNSMPTNQHPTAHLSLQERDDQQEEIKKLENWFQDGQRPARLEEFAQTVMAEAEINRMKEFGLGQMASADPLDLSSFKMFIQVHDILNSYRDESRTGMRSYFTKDWVRAQAEMCDNGPEGNNNFFGDGIPPVDRRPNREKKVERKPGDGGISLGGNWGGWNA